MNEILIVLKALPKVIINRKSVYYRVLFLPIIIYFTAILFENELYKYIFSKSIITQIIDNEFNITWYIWSKALIAILGVLPWVIALTLVIFKVHRITLLKQEFNKSDSRFLTFIWRAFVLGVWGIIFQYPFFYQRINMRVLELTGVSDYTILVVSIIWLLIGFYMIARWSLSLPAAAIGSPISLSKAWGLSRPHIPLLLGVVVLIPIGLLLIYKIFFYFILLLPIPYIGNILGHAISMVSTIIEIICLSLAYGLVMKTENRKPKTENRKPKK